MVIVDGFVYALGGQLKDNAIRNVEAMAASSQVGEVAMSQWAARTPMEKAR